MFDNEEDPFDAINNLTTKHYNDGYKEGEYNGKKAAIINGYKAGLNTSLLITNEFGYYYGICETYCKLNRSNAIGVSSSSTSTTLSPSTSPVAASATPTNPSEIISKSYSIATQICELITKIDINDSQYENLYKDLNHIRDKFKQFSSLTNFKSQFSSQEAQKLTF